MKARKRADIDSTLAALADPNRRRVVDLLRERPHSAGELAAAAHLSPPAMSRHLKILRASGLIDEARDELDSRVRIYSLKHGAMDELKSWLARSEALWTRQLAAFKAHVKRART